MEKNIHLCEICGIHAQQSLNVPVWYRNKAGYDHYYCLEHIELGIKKHPKCGDCGFRMRSDENWNEYGGNYYCNWPYNELTCEEKYLSRRECRICRNCDNPVSAVTINDREQEMCSSCYDLLMEFQDTKFGGEELAKIKSAIKQKIFDDSDEEHD